MVDFAKMQDDIYNGRAKDLEAAVVAALDEGVEPSKLLHEGLVAGMSKVGEDFKNNVLYVPEVLVAARAMKAGMKILQPKLAETGAKPEATIVVGTVKGDLHDIGKNLVAMMMEGAGFRVVDLGVDTSPEDFVEKAKAEGADLIGMSALLTTTMVNMKAVIDAVKKAGISTKTLIGGAPVTKAFADEIGADGYAPDAATAVEEARGLLGKAA
jgi:5-methyltetrahydrofolate--homocysteine methyltransferase